MELKHGRIHDKCPECGAELLIGPLSSFLPAIESTGFAGATLVTAHALPLCDGLSDKNERQWKELADAAYHDALNRKDDDAKRAEQAKADARNAQKGPPPRSHKIGNQKDR